MLTEKDLSGYELVSKYLRTPLIGEPAKAAIIEKLVSEVRELQAENARLRELLTQTGEKNVVRN